MRNKKGFTLVEVIVVLVILAILIAIAVPSVMKYIDDANDAKYLAEGRAVLVSSNAEAAVLRADGELPEGSLANIKETIIKVAEVDGEIIEITNNTKSCTSFVYQSEDKKRYVIYTLNPSKMEVVDEYNGDTPSIDADSPLSQIATFVDLLEFLTSNDIENKSINSNDPNHQEYIQLLENAGYDFDEMGAKTWRHFVDKSDGEKTKRFIWATVDITDFGDDVEYIPVMGYNYETKTYSAWNSEIDHDPNNLGAIKGNKDNIQYFEESSNYDEVFAEYTKQLELWKEKYQ